jgi:hypothetical protein
MNSGTPQQLSERQYHRLTVFLSKAATDGFIGFKMSLFRKLFWAVQRCSVCTTPAT